MKRNSKIKAKDASVARTAQIVSARGFRTILRRHFMAFVTLFLCTAFCVLAMVSSVMSLKVISVAHTLKVAGVLQAVEQSTPVKHDRGGIVHNVFVTEGEVVREGQILASLNTEDLAQELQAARQGMSRLLLRARCVRALKENLAHIEISEQLKQTMGRLRQVEFMERETARCEAELAQNQFDITLAKSELHAAHDLARLYDRMVQTKLLVNTWDAGKARGAVEQEELQYISKVLQQSIDATNAKRAYTALKTQQQKTQLARLTTLNQELMQISDSLVHAQAELTRMESLMKDKFIYASTSGRIQRMRIGESGRRIAPGAYVLEIAPLVTDFEVSSRISIAQAPHLSVGQEVQVKLSGGLPKPVWVPAKVEKILKTSQNNRLLSIRLTREDLNKRDLLLGDHSLNGLGEQSEAVISITSETALESLAGTMKSIWNAKPDAVQTDT